MMLQQMRASLRPGGRAIMAMAHGPLFRGGPEETIRRALLERGEIEAVVGIGPNLFSGTGLPACLFVLRKPDSGSRTPNDVLLINAEREMETERSKNRLEPRNTEKIARVFHQRAELPGFSKLVSFQELASAVFLRKYGAEVLYAGDGSSPLVGEDGQDWDAVLVVRYPDRKTFSRMVADREYQEITRLRSQALSEAVLQPTTPWGSGRDS